MIFARFTTQGPEGELVEVTLEADDQQERSDYNGTFTATLTIGVAGKTSAYPVSLDDNGNLRIAGLGAAGGAEARFALCLAACGLGHLVTEILDCWRQGHRTVAALFKCLRGKGLKISQALLACAFQCGLKAAAGS